MSYVVPTFTAAQVRAAEAPLLAAGVPLMRRAAAALASVVAETAAERLLVLAGAGDNGGDALFAAADAASRGMHVDVLRTSDRVHEAGLAAVLAAGAREIGTVDAEYDLVVDGILGIGAHGGLRGRAREVVASLLPATRSERPPRVIAVDLPSGLDPDDGSSDGVVLPADTTVTFGAVKAGLAQGSGPELAGRIVLVRLGLELDSPVGSTEVADIR